MAGAKTKVPTRVGSCGHTHLLDIVVAQRPPVLELLAREDQALLVRRDAFFVLDLGLHVVDRVAGLDLESDGLAREGLDEAGGVVRCGAVGRGRVGGGTYICTVGRGGS